MAIAPLNLGKVEHLHSVLGDFD